MYIPNKNESDIIEHIRRELIAIHPQNMSSFELSIKIFKPVETTIQEWEAIQSDMVITDQNKVQRAPAYLKWNGEIKRIPNQGFIAII